ncbi:MAG: EscU/YscU/HrcU family type III secretion system export apparatus switch protein, partial [Polyangiales bacterium]
MAEQDKDQRTEEATPRRKEKLREEGKIAKSADLGGATVVAGVLMTLTWVAPKCARDITAFSARLFALRDHRDPLVAVQGVHQIFSAVCLPTVSVAAVVALATGVAQTRGLFRPELALPKAERLNPLPQLKRIIPGKESALEIIKQLFKILALAAVAYAVLKDRVLSFSRLASLPPTVAALDVGRAAAELLLYGVLAFVAVAAFDYWLAWRRFREESKMSHQETRDERRQDEGDPHV